MSVTSYAIYLNVGQGQFFAFNALAAHLKKVYEGQIGTDPDQELDADQPPAALDQLFEMFNVNHPDDYHNRSLSVGDVVRLGNKYWSCSSIGWTELNEVEAQIGIERGVWRPVRDDIYASVGPENTQAMAEDLLSGRAREDPETGSALEFLNNVLPPTLGQVIELLQSWVDKQPPKHLADRLKNKPTSSTRVRLVPSHVAGNALWVVYDDETDTLILNQ